MLYAILCYNDEDVIAALPKQDGEGIMARLDVAMDKLRGQKRLGPVAQLLPTTAATTLRKGKETLVVDGPFAETKEQLLGFFVIECASLEAAIETARELAVANPTVGAYEVRPVGNFWPGGAIA